MNKRQVAIAAVLAAMVGVMIALSGCAMFQVDPQAAQRAIDRREAYIARHPHLNKTQREAIRDGETVYMYEPVEALMAANVNCHKCEGHSMAYRDVQVDRWDCGDPPPMCGGTSIYVRDGKVIGWAQ